MTPYDQIDQLQAENQTLSDINKQQQARIAELEHLLRINSDLIRCGIGGNYGGKCYDDKIATNYQPVIDALSNTTPPAADDCPELLRGE